jgi:hypothetical protein
MIEMEVRVDDEVDLVVISVNRFEACADLLAGPKADTKQPGKPRAEPSSRVELAIGVQPWVERARPFGCSIRKTGIGTVMSPSPPFIRWANSPVTVPRVKA